MIFDALDARQHLLLQLVPFDRAHRDQRRQRLRQRSFDALDHRAAERAPGGGGSQTLGSRVSAARSGSPTSPNSSRIMRSASRSRESTGG